MDYIERFQNAQPLSVSVGNTYSADQLIQTFQYKFHQCGKYSAQIPSDQAELRREEKFTDKNIYLFHPYKLIIKILTAAQVLVEIVKEKTLLIKIAPFVEVLITLLTNLSKG